MPKKEKNDHKSPRHRTIDPEANHTPSSKSNSHAMTLCLPFSLFLLLSLRLAYPCPFTIGTSTYARFVLGGGPHTKGSSPSSSSLSTFIGSSDEGVLFAFVFVLGGVVGPSERGGTLGLLGRKSGSGSEGGGSTRVESSSTDLAFSFPFPLSGLAVLDGVTRSQTPNQYTIEPRF
jgi:hypothetical protein